ncbi:tripartite tricarboxylate transporter substrate binding protein [Variovorax guangxiensis]|uniref:Bug family tripartite tricarboxylate transporter substrate binding protein n=1 Tax=Variovorax guangxiensis TaxID=1775474 RepID=UPI00285F0EC4|nr:tripartite tricarboxylate transporter substrate binding protein [Variovorax guangxiensis]MDR6861069.1 tripartite-type tricarboxylate transporter receptor subunit TctC [Variovorax guangxiensis]
MIPSLSLLRAFTAAVLILASASALSQAYPDKPIHIVVPFSAGGGLDAAARVLGQGLTKRLGQPVIVENKPGGNGLIATQYVTGAKPDGYTLYLCVTTPWSMLPALYKRPLGYDANKAYTAISLLAEFQTVIFVNPKTGITSMKAYVERAKVNPGKLSYASTGSAQPYTLATELLKSKMGIDVLHVPFPGAAPATQSVVAGDVDSAMFDVGGSAPFIKAGRLTPLAVLGKSRVPSLPDVPTLTEAGITGFDIPMIWMGVVGPGGLPPAIVRKLNEEINTVLRGDEMTALLAAQSLTPLVSTPEQMDAQIKGDIQSWGAVIKQLGIQLD